MTVTLLRVRVQGQECCQKAYRKLYRIGNNQLNRKKKEALARYKDSKFSFEPYSKSRGTWKEGALLNQAKEYLQSVEDTIAENMPHDSRVHKETGAVRNACFIPTGLFGSKFAVYTDFARWVKSSFKGEGKPRVASWSTFYTAWRKFFWHLFLRFWIPFAKCDQCVDLLESLRVTKDEKEKEKIKELQKEHRKYIEDCRLNYKRRIDLAEQNPDKYLSVIMDAMDSNKTNVPHWRAFFSKERADFSVKTRLLGVLVHHKRFDGYWTLPRY